MKVYRDKFWKLEEYTVNASDDIFQLILEHRCGDIDKERFFLKFMPEHIVEQYDFTNSSSVDNFRDTCLYRIDSPLMGMGGYNMDSRYLKDDIRENGIKMSDPYGKIYGSFDIRNGIITYSPIFPHFYIERDLTKFANDEYFTTMTFEDIMRSQIDRAVEFYVHTGGYRSLKDIYEKGIYALDKVSKDQMLEFVCNPNEGAKVLKRYLGN